MTKTKKSILNSIYDGEQYIFSVSGKKIFLSKRKTAKILERTFKSFKNISFRYTKKGVVLSSLYPFAKCCRSKKVIKKGFTTRKLKLGKNEVIIFRVQRYQCKHCGKTFQTDLTDIVGDNCKFYKII